MGKSVAELRLVRLSNSLIWKQPGKAVPNRPPLSDRSGQVRSSLFIRICQKLWNSGGITDPLAKSHRA